MRDMYGMPPSVRCSPEAKRNPRGSCGVGTAEGTRGDNGGDGVRGGVLGSSGGGFLESGGPIRATPESSSNADAGGESSTAAARSKWGRMSALWEWVSVASLALDGKGRGGGDGDGNSGNRNRWAGAGWGGVRTSARL